MCPDAASANGAGALMCYDVRHALPFPLPLTSRCSKRRAADLEARKKTNAARLKAEEEQRKKEMAERQKQEAAERIQREQELAQQMEAEAKAKDAEEERQRAEVLAKQKEAEELQKAKEDAERQAKEEEERKMREEEETKRKEVCESGLAVCRMRTNTHVTILPNACERRDGGYRTPAMDLGLLAAMLPDSEWPLVL